MPDNAQHYQIIENNQVTIIGEIISDFTFSHEVYGEGFYMVDISVKRLSESYDIIPVMISERLLDVTRDLQRRDASGIRSVPLLQPA